MTILCSAIGAALLMLGCASAQQPYSFEVRGARPDAVGDVVRGLASAGQQSVATDRASGVVHTAWQDTGFRYGFINQVEATIVRRYTATIQPSAQGTFVVLRADAMRCARGSYAIQGANLSGTCELMDGLVGSHQSDLDDVGQRLQTALTTGGLVVATR